MDLPCHAGGRGFEPRHSRHQLSEVAEKIGVVAPKRWPLLLRFALALVGIVAIGSVDPTLSARAYPIDRGQQMLWAVIATSVWFWIAVGVSKISPARRLTDPQATRADLGSAHGPCVRRLVRPRHRARL